MKKTVWHKGPPPEIGWWPASYLGHNKRVIRWWNGKVWGCSCDPSWTESEAEAQANTESPKTTFIQWTDKWWL
jgi:hypothetical protein